MKIDKIYNNNVVQVLDDSGQEIIVMGRGLGFGRKVGDQLDENLIEKTFFPRQEGFKKEWYQIYDSLTEEEIAVVLEIIALAENELAQTFETSFYIALADHLNYAIERTKEGISLQNPLTWEIRKFYPTEYQLGLKALEVVKTRLAVTLTDDEAASLALHFVNARKDSGLLDKNYQISKIVIDILDIVRLHYGQDCQVDESSLHYNRFVTHVTYFAQRVVNGLVQGVNDAFLYQQVRENYPRAFACTQKIKAYVASNHQFEMSRDEEVYLTIHIQRLGSK